MKKVLLYGSKLSYNFGGPCIFFSTIKLFPKDLYEVSFYPQSPEDNLELIDYYKSISNIKFITAPRQRYLFLAFFWLTISSILPKKISKLLIRKIQKKNPYCHMINEYDLVCDIRGISQTDFFGNGFKSYIGENMLLGVSNILGKKTAKLTQDMGPFNKYSNRKSTQYFFKKYNLIIARGIVTKELLYEIGISRNVIVKPDSAFLMDYANENELAEVFNHYSLKKGKYILIAPSKQIDKRSEKNIKTGHSKYIEETSMLINKLTNLHEEYDIVLLPNERLKNKKGTDDLTVAQQLKALSTKSDKIKIISEDFDAFTLKGIISNAHICISSRYHTTVASISTNVPVVVIGWGYKYDQLLTVSGIPSLIENHKTFNANTFYPIFKAVIDNRDYYSSIISKNVEEIKKDIYKNVDIINRITENE